MASVAPDPRGTGRGEQDVAPHSAAVAQARRREAGAASDVSDRVVTVPNALSLLRLLGVPVFLWLILAHHDGWALAVLMVSGATDYLDGKLARRWNQMTRLGQLLDPLADRLYILATLVGLTIRDILPLWLTVLIVGRDVLLTGTLPVLRRHGYGPLPVHFLGKAATFNLLYAFPLLLLGDGSGAIATVANVFGWAFAIWGTCLYWWAGVLYVVQVRQLAVAGRGGSGSGAPGTPAAELRG